MTVYPTWPDGSANPLDDVREAIAFMRMQLGRGPWQMHHAMCRLSLPMAEFLLAQLDLAAKVFDEGMEDARLANLEMASRAQAKIDELKETINDNIYRAEKAEAHVRCLEGELANARRELRLIVQRGCVDGY